VELVIGPELLGAYLSRVPQPFDTAILFGSGTMAWQIVPSTAWIIVGVLLWAAGFDLWKRRVPNVLTYGFIVSGLVTSVATAGLEGLGGSLGGAATALGLMVPLFLLGGMGAGDVKLFIAIGAWTGPAAVLGIGLHAALAGGVLGAAIIAWNGSFEKHFTNLILLIEDLKTLRQGLHRLPQIEANSADLRARSVAVPFALPVAVGAISYFLTVGSI
jgi:prepilin peptidase CpaA